MHADWKDIVCIYCCLMMVLSCYLKCLKFMLVDSNIALCVSLCLGRFCKQCVLIKDKQATKAVYSFYFSLSMRYTFMGIHY